MLIFTWISYGLGFFFLTLGFVLIRVLACAGPVSVFVTIAGLWRKHLETSCSKRAHLQKLKEKISFQTQPITHWYKKKAKTSNIHSFYKNYQDHSQPGTQKSHPQMFENFVCLIRANWSLVTMTLSAMKNETSHVKTCLKESLVTHSVAMLLTVSLCQHKPNEVPFGTLFM